MPRPAHRRRSPRGGAAITGMLSTINVTPMVDVMLVLLIIFLVVTPLLAAGFRAELPEAPGIRTEESRDMRIVLGIDQEGEYFVDGKPVVRADLGQVLHAIFSMRTADKILYLQADRQLRYQRVLDAITIARDAGVRVVAAVTEDRGEQGVKPPRAAQGR